MTDDHSSHAPEGRDEEAENAPLARPQAISSSGSAVELSGTVPETPPAGNGVEQHNPSPESSRSKPEGSSYASAYRPSNSRGAPPNATNVDERLRHEAAYIDAAPEENFAQPPPAYTELPGQLLDDSNELGANAIVCDDGRVNININQKSRRISQLFAPQLARQITQVAEEPAPPPPYVPEFLGGAPGQEPPPPLNVVIHVVGSRGDVQPFVALGKVLKETYGHRVRLATHPTFQKFVTENGLEFFSISGDPAELMAFMVKNPGLMPGFDTLRSGAVGKRRKDVYEVLRGTWRSCIESGNGLGVDPLKQSIEEWMGVEDDMPEELKKPFVADAIIANPPSFGHIHCAEKLGIPLHMMFTMPWSPTQQFPHPLANIQSTNADPSMTNYISYTLVEMLTWQGLGDLINRFRKDSLGLDPISMIWAPGMLGRLKIPHTYCWSPALIPKPKDWGHHITVAGFCFLSLAQNYTPAPDLAAFLAAGEPPVYIGFGSIVVDDPNAMTNMIFEAVKKTGRRALVSKGWGGLGADELGIPEGVFMLGNVPHDWLFKHVSAVVHHGGAGTTSAGIAAGRPTVVVPFFGDQPFWGAMTAKAGAGPPPVPYKELTADKLAESIEQALKPESLERAQELAQRINEEQGNQKGAQAFHQMLKYDDLRCAVYPSRPAVWRFKRTQVRLSAMTATVLAQAGELDFSELKLFRPREYETDEGPWDPISGGATAIIGTASTMMMGVADFPIETLKLLNIHPDAKKGKEKAKDSANTSASGDASRKGRNRKSKRTTNTRTSASSSASTLPGLTTPLSEVDTQSPSGSFEFHRGSTDLTPGTPNRRSTFMAQAMAASTEVKSRSPSRERHCAVSDHRHGHGRSKSRTLSQHELRSESGISTSTFADRLHGMNPDAAKGTGKGIARIVGAGFKSPMDFSLNVAKGFHNVPKLYGGEVRQVDKVTDLQSGVKTGFKELGLGMYESITGLVTDPYKGAKKEGATGFVKGVGRGIAGLPLRFMGGVFSLPGYAMKGLYQEGLKSKGANVQNYIIAARISQGYDEANALSDEAKTDIINSWRNIKSNVKKKKNVGEDQIEALHTLMKEKRAKRHERFETIVRHRRPEARPTFPPALHEHNSYEDVPTATTTTTRSAGATGNGNAFGPASPINLSNTTSHTQEATPSHSQIALEQQQERLQADEEEAERRELETAIAASVSETSRGNPEEDDMIARAIRASMKELERTPADTIEDEEQALQRAMKASIEEAGKSGATEEEQKLLEETLKKSILETSVRQQHGSDSEWDDSDSEEHEEFKRIIAESKALAELDAQARLQAQGQQLPPSYASLDAAGGAQESGVIEGGPATHTEASEDDLKKALEESEREERDRMAELEKQKTEEEIIMEYVKKQSLVEEEHRRRLMQGRETGGESSRGAAGGSSSGAGAGGSA